MIVGEDGRGADEHSVFKDGRLVDKRIILQLAVCAHTNARADVRSSPDHTIRAYLGALPDLGEMPDSCSRTECRLG